MTQLLRNGYFRRLFVPYLLMIWLGIAGVGAFSALRLRSVYMESRRQALHDDLQLVSDLINTDVLANRIGELNRRIQGLGKEIGCRITVIAADGTVLADNWADPRTMVNHLNRPEIQSAIRQGEAYRSRSSATVHTDMLYVARPLHGEGGKTYYLRLAVPLRDLDRELWLLHAGLAAFAVVAMLAAGIVCYQMARRHTAPILELTDAARALRAGDLSRRSGLPSGDEIGVLASTFNSMADTLQGLLIQAEHDRARLLTILSSMSEGLIGMDADQYILFVNEAAGTLLGFDVQQAQGKPLWQVVRMEEIIKAAQQTLREGRRCSFELGKVGGRHLEVGLSTFPSLGRPEGLVLVVHDHTQSFRYQELRREFVANVSHELRTPLTVIKGYAETLREGALADPEKAEQYLAIIDKHATQLTNLVGDLLELSRLESQIDMPRRTGVDMAAAARKVIDLLAPAAQMKTQVLEADLQHVPAVLGNPDYIERAITNLVDNAIKYTPEKGRIAVSVRAEGAWAVLEVSDNGIGIPVEDLPRIFERFYRVDRSRSREMGGTGLGLSIVKHVAQSHGGTVDVESTAGQGSTFRLKLPLPRSSSLPADEHIEQGSGSPTSA